MSPDTVNPSYKVIADHLRSSSFLIADGVLPSNEGRGYVLRRIMRRAMRHAHKLGAKNPVMYKLVPTLIKEMGGAYPELNRAKDVIIETLKNEEEKFRETLNRGMEILDEELTKIKEGEKFPGQIAFKLYDTYGFPLDLTEDVLREKNIKVDIEEFNREMELQRQRARQNWVGSGEVAEDTIFFELKEKFGETKFLGYETNTSKAKILAIIENAVILDQTPFYATSGGQKGDDGKICLAADENKFIEISETKKFAGNLFVHFTTDKIPFKTGDEVIAKVNDKTRLMRAANHSATHLLHKALKEILGNSISQKGSNVDAEYFTFDFNFNRAMSEEEKQKVEDLVNFYIRQNSKITTNLMKLDKARDVGAEALFGEKYDSDVRVLSMGETSNGKPWSVELCGGTHAKSTGEIEIFKIISEKSVASGIRRIEAKSGLCAKKYLSEKEEKLKNYINELKEKIKQKNQEILALGSKKTEETVGGENDLEKFSEILQQILKKQDKEIERLKKEKLSSQNSNLTLEKIGSVNFIHHFFDGVSAKDLRDLTNQIKSKKEYSENSILAFFGFAEEKVSVIIAVTPDLTSKFEANKLISPAVEKIGGKGGGGKADMAMGGGIDVGGIESAVTELKQILSA